ncbi:MAG TPA: Fe-S cluster assembly protein SufD [Solirubrobacteraceae bacterium]|nr:Fe-S cluster assembly protein SufD [Solirubrobacteraceae bacterium]
MASSTTASAATEPAWLAARRARAAELTASLPLPSYRGTPGWEFTSLKNVDLDSFGRPEATDVDAGGLGLIEPPDGALLLEQVDHVFADPLEPAPDGAIVMSLTAAVTQYPELVERHFGSIVSGEDPFVARNDAAWQGGAFVFVPRGVHLQVPVVVTVVQSQAQTALHWRTLVVLEEGAQAEVFEQYVSTADSGAGGLFSTVTELSVGQNANLRYVCAQGLNEKSWIFGAQRAVVERDGALDWIALGFGAGNGRVAMDTQLAGPGSDAKVTGAYATHGRQHLDYATTQEHAAPNTTSDLAFRGILDGRSSTVWSGMIKVDPGAQQIDAFQESRNLLLTKTAHADSIPGLEILANDVRCTHAAAIAQIDPEQLYYLRSRGLPLERAKRLVIEGFLEATVERFQPGFVREAVAGALERRLEAVLGA